MVEGKKVSEEGIESGYELLYDLTEAIRKETVTFYDFPKDLKILKAKLFKGPDGWGGVVRYLIIWYEFDGIQHKMMRPVYANAKSLVIDMIFDIVDHYRRTHL